MALEEATGVTIADDALPTIKTVGDVMNYLNAQNA
jgi:acyl carrier protein